MLFMMLKQDKFKITSANASKSQEIKITLDVIPDEQVLN
jgi:hypothetical protein